MEADRSRNHSLRKAVIDTNVLMYIFTERVDVFSQLRELGYRRFVFPVQIIEELRRLSLTLDGNDRRAAIFALNLVDRCSDCEIFDLRSEGSDNAILKLAEMENAVIITNDKNLRRRAKERGIAVGYLREMKYVEIEEDY